MNTEQGTWEPRCVPTCCPGDVPTLSMGYPPSAHSQTKRPTSGPSTPLNPGCLGGRINPLQSPFLFLPSHACLASKAGLRRQTHQVQSVFSYTHESIPLPIWDAPTRSPFQILLPPTGLNVFFRFGPVAPDYFRVCPGPVFSANLSATKPYPPAAHSPSTRQDGQPNLVRSLHHCSLIKSPGPYWDYTVLKDPSAISTHPSPTDSIPRVALPRLTFLHPVTGALSC